MKHVCKGLLLGLLVMVVALSLFACPATEDPDPTPAPAETVSVTFQNGDTTVATKTVDKGTALTAADIPAAPVAEGKTFLGWYVGDTKVEAGYTATADVTATAKFEDITYTLTFKNGEETVATKTVKYGTALVAADIPAAPAAEGKTFLGWYVGDTKVEAGYTATADVTATAKFEDITYTLTFKNGEETVATVTVKHGATPAEDALPADPEKAGYAFDGWKSGDVVFDETAAVTGDATYTAAFTKTHYFVTFKNGTKETLVLVPMDAAALTAEMIPATPAAADGSACTGWFAGDVKAAVGTAITADTTFEPHFVAAAAFAGTYADVAKGETMVITEALAVSGKATGTAVLTADGTLSWKVGGTTYTVALTADGVTLTVNAWDGMEEDFVDTVYAMARLSAVEGLAGTYKFSRTTKYTVNELGIITGYNNNSAAPYFGLVTKNADGTLTISLKTSASGKVSSYAVTVDEQGNWVVNDGYAKIYVRADADATVKAYYNSTTKEYLHVFYLKKGSTAEKVITYTVDKDHVCIYATIEGKIAANSIVTFTAGEKTATVKLGKLSSSDMAFTYPAAERGKTYTGTLGDITLDGFGTTKIGASDKTYVLNGDKLIIGDGEYAMTLTEATEEGGKGTYVVLDKDAYAGTYVIYNNYEETKNYTIVLDGYGTITLKGKSSSVVGTYTVSGTTITVAKCSSYNGEWTILAGHDGKAMTMTKYGKKYDLVLNTYYPAGIESAIANLLGKWQDAAGNKITVYWWDAASTYAIDGFGATTLRLTPYWDGSVLLCAGWSDNCSDYAGSKATLLISRDGETLVVSHTCQRKDEYDEPESVAVRVTYTAAAEEPFAFEEGLRGNWKTEDGTYKLVIGETTLTLNGAEATDIAYDSTTGTYTFKANGTSYEIFSYFGAWFVGVTGGESAQLVADTGEVTLDAFAGTWKTSGFSTLVIDGKGNYTLGDVSGTYTIGADGVATVADPTIHGFDSDPMTFTLKDGKLVVDYYYDYTATSKTLEKQA